MNKIALFFAGIALSTAAIGADNNRIVKTGIFPQTKGMVVVAEGDFEPRGIGSYSLRVYAKNDPAYPYDEFITGTIRPRNGTIESLTFADLDHDGTQEIIVTTRYIGSGNYVTVDAFRLRKKNLQFITSIAGMDAKLDAVQALKKKLGKSR
ncbi:PliI family lysozyme inhibitor of I-type lysozyme [Herminiimonas arsenitoxidans]|uniref:PliI family lysozyme inhibitor of I-type lysozyme n=1 Tax=Herminiimonas arsenitoxidans TaxID=1809410 RepID=UPI000970276B|nr:PliI family lysozyme inhibitor of I-type lysozyme [Herminiimonas arsenitoxidans]